MLVLALDVLCVPTEASVTTGALQQLFQTIKHAAQAYSDWVVVGIACQKGLRGPRGREMNADGFKEILTDFPLMKQILYCPDLSMQCYRIRRKNVVLIRQTYGEWETYKPPSLGMLQVAGWDYRPLITTELVGTTEDHRAMAERLNCEYAPLDVWLRDHTNPVAANSGTL